MSSTSKRYSIDVQGVSRYFDSKKEQRFYALSDATLQVEQGELFGLLGPNGAGKSTLIKILSTLLLPSEGTAKVAGFDVVREGDRVRRSINMVSGGEHSGYGILTVRESLWLFSQFHGISSKTAFKRIDEALEVVGLADSAATRINKLSTGMRQKMNFVRGLLNDPKVLFLDEPTLGLDVETARILRDYLKQWIRERPDRTVLLTTHYMAEADELCGRLAIIDGGCILQVDTPANLKRTMQNEVVLRTELSSDTGAIPRFGTEPGSDDGAILQFGTEPQGTVSGHALGALDDLSNLPGVLRIVPEPVQNGTRMVTWGLRDDGTIANVIWALQERGIRIVSLEKADVTLEDVFLRMVGRRLTDDGGKAESA